MMTSDDVRAAEISRIERELENLESRYRALQDTVKWLTLSFRAFVIALAVLMAWGAVVENVGLFVASMGLLALSGLAALLGPACFGPGLALSGRTVRWIDVVGWNPPGILGVSIKRSEAMAVEEMIAERRSRLAQLCGQRS